MPPEAVILSETETIFCQKGSPCSAVAPESVPTSRFLELPERAAAVFEKIEGELSLYDSQSSVGGHIEGIVACPAGVTNN
ncbi:hypothetical protein D1BOALGB6SA_5189 [Olavius sp. associated proteobacterium Delta 1]|nr:hypothetical protein D1BOALGB6SA_5189 [Olavius sp. associated proteobacterium Delta 1]